MALLDLIRNIRAAPYRYLGEICPIQLGIFLSGYDVVDNGIDAADAAVVRAIGGNRQLGLGMCARLAEPDPRRALEWVLELYEQALLEHEEGAAVMPHATMPVVEVLREHIVKGRSPVVIGEPTVAALFSFVNGHVAGLEATNPALAASERAALAAFEQWLRATTGVDCQNASWHVILRAYHGTSERGIRAFLTLWDQHAALSAPRDPAPQYDGTPASPDELE